jgi:uncharacterized membrane protein
MFKFLDKINPAHFFVCAAIILGGFYFVLRPPLQSPDEFNHFLRAYQISEGTFLPIKKDHRLGGEVPVCFNEFQSLYMPCTFIPDYKITRTQWTDGFDIAFNDKTRIFVDFPNTCNYSPISYLPQVATLFVMRHFNCSVALMYHVTRLVAFLLWLIAMVFVIKTLPAYKWLFTLAFLLPMSLYLSVSITADTVTNILSFMLMALVFKYALQAIQLSKQALLLIAAVCVLLALSKIIYGVLLLLLLLLPVKLFKSKLQKYLVLGGIVFVAFLSTNLWMTKVTSYMISYEEYNPMYKGYATLLDGVDYQKQKEHLVAHPEHFPLVLYNTTFKTAEFYLSSYIGRFGTYMDTPLPFWMIVCAYLLIGIVAITEKNTVVFNFKAKLIIFFTAVLTFSFIILSQHLIWNKVGKDIADSIQGRYLIPIMPLVFLLFNANWRNLKVNIAPLILVLIFFGNMRVLRIIYKRYYKEYFISKIDFTCGAETITKSGSFGTSDANVFLEGGDKRVSNVHRTGNYSIMLTGDSTVSGMYEFKNLQQGDLVEIYAWQKGNGGELVVEGKGLRCAPFHFVNKDIQITEKTGWKKMQMLFTMFVNCDSSDVKFYLHNPTPDTIYFDDLRYSIKKIK